MNDYINEGADVFNEDDPYKKKSPLFVRILKWLGVGVILLVVLLLFLRCLSHRDHPIDDKVLMNEAFYEAYEEDPSSLRVRKYGMPSPWVSVDQGRLIEFDALYHIPKTKQLQVTLIYNEDIVPEGVKGMPFKMYLEDEEGNVFSEFWYEEGKIERFVHMRVCFENIEIEMDELDINSNPLRHTYVLKMEMKQPNGEYEKLCEYTVYNGKSEKMAVFRDIKYEVEKNRK